MERAAPRLWKVPLGTRYGRSVFGGDSVRIADARGVLRTYVQMFCDCGAKFHMLTHNLRAIQLCGGSASCRQCRKKDGPGGIGNRKYPLPQIGERFGNLVVVSKPVYKKYQKQSLTVVGCRCECGVVRDYLINNLRKGHTKSCGASKHRKQQTSLENAQ